MNWCRLICLKWIIRLPEGVLFSIIYNLLQFFPIDRRFHLILNRNPPIQNARQCVRNNLACPVFTLMIFRFSSPRSLETPFRSSAEAVGPRCFCGRRSSTPCRSRERISTRSIRPAALSAAFCAAAQSCRQISPYLRSFQSTV